MNVKKSYFARLFLCTFLLFASGLASAEDPSPSKDLTQKTVDFRALAQTQRTIEFRNQFLKQHRIWSLTTVAALGATLLSTNDDRFQPAHSFFAGVTAASYIASLYTAWMIPASNRTDWNGRHRWHRRLVYVHLPAMVLAPVLGYLAAQKHDKNESLSGLERYHKEVGYTAAGGVALSAAIMTFEF